MSGGGGTRLPQRRISYYFFCVFVLDTALRIARCGHSATALERLHALSQNPTLLSIGQSAGHVILSCMLHLPACNVA